MHTGRTPLFLGTLGLVAFALFAGCARGYWSFPICKEFGPASGDVTPPNGPPPEVNSATGSGAARQIPPTDPPSRYGRFLTPAILIDVVLLPLTVPIDLGLWIARRREIAVDSRLERSRELSFAGYPVLAFSEILEAVMLDPQHPEVRSLLEAHVRRESGQGKSLTRDRMVAEALRHYDALAASADTEERASPAFRDRAELLSGAILDLAPDHERRAALAPPGE